ncbi:MAG: hypothetical protein PHV59_07380, partial [Victivallales bacterium]|nr:hypothetical protein [Victivallales bacterium]
HREFVAKKIISLRDGNLLRAASEFIHTQLAFIDKNAYNHLDIGDLSGNHVGTGPLFLSAF